MSALGIAACVAGPFASGCRQRDAAEVRDVLDSNAQNFSTLFDYREPGSNLPPSGRSLFDRLFATPNGASPPLTVSVPYPFPKIVERLRNEGFEIASALIPRGRSLERNAAKPDYFKFPRLVVTPVPTIAHFDAVHQTELEGRLFIGFVEPARQMEVISFNEEAGRFEFQIVTDYGEGGSPQVYYADRALCLACHQSQGPIFPTVPWNETNENPVVEALIQAAHPGEASYQGVPIGDDSRPEAQDSNLLSSASGAGLDTSFGRLNVIDDELRQANNLVMVQTLWNEGCSDGDPAQECRAQLLRSAFGKTETAAVMFSLESKIKANFLAIYPPKIVDANGRVVRPTSRIPPIKLLNNLPADAGPAAAALQAVKNSIEDLHDSDSISPLLIRRIVDSDDGSGFALNAFRQAIGTTTFRKFTDDARETAIDQLIDEERQKSDGILARRRFDRAKVLAAFAAKLGATLVSGCCHEAAGLEAPKERPAPAQGGVGDRRVQPFVQYCGRCHSGDIDPSFVAGTEAEGLAQLNARAKELYARLDWDASGGRVHMPPTSSAEYKDLVKPENESRRAEMLVILNQFIQVSAAVP